MVVEIISVGTELLLGNIVNTNAAFLSEQCAILGLSCFHQEVVGDNKKRLSEVIGTAVSRSDVVILGGGLGPTQDDLTKECAAEVLGMPLVEDANTHNRIKEYLEKRGYPITENNWKQAWVPVGCKIVDNENGTAPGIIMEKEGKHVILLPGPPNELIPMFYQDIRPYLDALTPGTIYSRTVKLCGIGESMAEEMVRDLIDEQTNPTIATYAKTGEVHLRVTASAEDEKAAKALVKPMVKELKERFGNAIYTTDSEVTLEKAVMDSLMAQNMTICTAESCTAGLLAARLTNVAGASDVIKCGYITYSNKAKRRMLGIKKTLLDTVGPYSKECAKAMAKNAAVESGADVAVSVTGIAGPDGGTEETPVGTVFIGCSVKGEVTVKEYHFGGNRAKIREQAVAYALIQVRECLLQYNSEVMFGKKEK